MVKSQSLSHLEETSKKAGDGFERKRFTGLMYGRDTLSWHYGLGQIL